MMRSGFRLAKEAEDAKGAARVFSLVLKDRSRFQMRAQQPKLSMPTSILACPFMRDDRVCG
jgi:hypothetical protein